MADLIETYLPAASTPAQGAKLVKLPPVKAPKLAAAEDNEPATENEDDAETPASAIPAPKELGSTGTVSNSAPAALAPTPMQELQTLPQSVPQAAAPAPLTAPEITQSEVPQPKAPAQTTAKARPLAAPEPANAAPSNALAYAAPVANPPVEPKEIAVTPNGLKLAWQTGAQPVDPRTTGSKRPAAGNSVFIQIGTAQSESDAKRLLSSARDKGGAQLSAADMRAEKVTVNGKTLWRARFSMNDESLAHDVCKTLKKNKMACFVSRG
jgi:D-alanyl-D-alanine carboxypeptidase